MVKIIKKKFLSPWKKRKEERLKRTFKKLQHLSEEELAFRLAKENHLPYIDLSLFAIDPETVQIIPEKDARKFKIASFQKTNKRIRLAIFNPALPGFKKYLDYLKKEKGWQISPYIVSFSSLEKAWKKYNEKKYLTFLDLTQANLTTKDLDKFEEKFKNLINLKERILELPTTEIINTIIAGALKMGASDIHLEPQDDQIRLRYRLDGVLQDIGFFPKKIHHQIIFRLKMMSKMKINLHDIAQDGHFTIKVNKERIDIRSSVLPGNYGETIVMRLLDQRKVLLTIEKLGLRGKAYELVKKEIARPNGMILTTGPTGSGKTTTLYSFINLLNKPGVKIVTIENPIEYQIENISQTQVAPDRHYSFAEGLRAIVRQDPDIILVGEIRDDETADIAINAALTGHLVLSTLHTNNAAGTIPRFIELGARPNLIAASANIFMAQRLVRKLCPYCKEKYKPADKVANLLKELLSVISPRSNITIPKNIDFLYRSRGCSHCNYTGYKGRIGIFEVLPVSENIKQLILKMESEDTITQTAIEEGMVTMAQDGIIKAIEGITSLEEVQRVAGETKFLKNLYNKLMEQSLSRGINIEKKNIDKIKEYSHSPQKFQSLIKKTPFKKLTEYILTGALLWEAEDIHIEPEEKDVVIRYRIDGVIQNMARIPLDEYPFLLGKLKLLSGLKSEKQVGLKDSRFTLYIENNSIIQETKVNIRISFIAGGYGETVIMKFSNHSAIAKDIEQLEILPYNLKRIIQETSKPNGLFLNAGPTGSGKTTTLYSILSGLSQPELKIITVEDPIEYQLKGILQTQVNKEKNYTFATALRSLLRQNPDILMVGEIRDDETAKITVQASISGHLLLSTLRTNDASGVAPRLIGLGVDADNLANSANAFMSQRLVRKLCSCKKRRKIKPEEKEEFKKIIKSVSSKIKDLEITLPEYIYEPNGCEKCNHLGYKGRAPISEVLVVDDSIRHLIAQRALATDIKQKAVQNGMITMYEDGIIKIIQGKTTFEEVRRVTSF